MNATISLRLHERGTGTKLVRIRLTFIQDLEDPLQVGSPIRYQMSSLVKVIQFGSVRFYGGTVPV